MNRHSCKTIFWAAISSFFFGSFSVAQTKSIDPKGRVLVVVSSATQISLREGGTYPVGVFLGELTEPAEAMLQAGYELTFASPQGVVPTIDKDSAKPMYFGYSQTRLNHAKSVWESLLQNGLSSPIQLEQIAADVSHLSKFDAVFVPGGHGPLVDLYRRNAPIDMSINSDMGKLLSFFHFAHRPTGLICHAPVALAAAPDVNGTWIYAGYKVTGISRVSDFFNEDFWLTRIYPGHEFEHVEDVLRAAGADYRFNAIPMVPFVVDDRELMTGQDPFAASLIAKRFVRKLNQYVLSKTELNQ